MLVMMIIWAQVGKLIQIVPQYFILIPRYIKVIPQLIYGIAFFQSWKDNALAILKPNQLGLLLCFKKRKVVFWGNA